MRRRLRLVVVAIAAPLVAWGIAALTLEVVYRCTHGFWEVVDGQCYRAAEMAPEQVVEVCKRHGIRIVMDLRSDLDGRHTKPTGWARRKIEAERAALEAAGIRHVAVQARQISNSAITDRFVDTLCEPGTRPVLMHCDHGIGRTGFFVALYLIEFERCTHEEARRRVARFYSLRPGGRRHFRPDRNKGRHLMQYVARSDRLGTG